MQQITLPNIYAALRDRQHVVEVPEPIADRARAALQRMLDIGRRETVR
jgi:quinolinate synthase